MAGTPTPSGLRSGHAPIGTPQRRSTGRGLIAEPSRLVWLAVAAAMAAAIWLAIATLGGTPTAAPSPAERAATARLQGLADEYEAARAARSNAAATARLQGLADEYEAARSARANAAATARLQGLADEYSTSHDDRPGG